MSKGPGSTTTRSTRVCQWPLWRWRTARGSQRRTGPAADLAAETLKALVERTGIDPALVDDVIMGCVMQVGNQGLNIGRNAVLAAGWPETVPATTVDRQCGSSQQAAHFAAQGVIAGAYDIAVAAGVEVMTQNPMGSSMTPGSIPFGHRMLARYTDPGLVPQGISAEMIADQWEIPRSELDEIGVALAVTAAGMVWLTSSTSFGSMLLARSALSRKTMFRPLPASIVSMKESASRGSVIRALPSPSADGTSTMTGSCRQGSAARSRATAS